MKYLNRTNIAWIACMGISLGLTTSPAIISIATGILTASVGISTQWKTYLTRFIKQPVAVLFTSLFVLHLLSYFYTDNVAELSKEIRIKLPLLLLPITLVNLPSLSEKQKYSVLLMFLGAVSFTGLVSFVNYLIHYESITANIIHSKEVPILPKMSHIYYSMIAAFAIWVGYYLYKRESILWHKNEKKWILGLSIFLVICLHIFTARTGLVAFYVSLLLFLVRQAILKKQYKPLYVGLGLMIIAPTLLAFISKGFQDRIINTTLDIRKYRSGANISYRSISLRLAAWETALHIIQRSPVIGVGIGDNEDEMRKQYPKERFVACHDCLTPNTHNQFVEFTLAFGILGLLTMLLLFGIALHQNRSTLFWALGAICLFSMMTEAILERQVGVTFMTFFWLWVIKNENTAT